MARGRSGRVESVKTALAERLRGGSAYRPGDRFLSARELAAEFGVSYQTAHGLLAELEAEGLLERRAASGTYVPGGPGDEDTVPAFTGVVLIFDRRAGRAQSFGARLLAALSDRLRREGVHWEVRWESEATLDGLPGDHYPVLWEAPVALADCLRTRRPALLLNARPAPGLDAARLDSVSVDDHFGGACAADLLAGAEGAHFAVLTGPAGDPRSDARRDGFLSRAPGAAVVPAGGWYHEHGAGIAADALRAGPDGVFCVNDRLAEALLLHARRAGLPRPRVVGFDDAPVAAAEDLTTIAIPWDELAADAAEIVRRRLAGDDSAARRRLIAPRPVIRTL